MKAPIIVVDRGGHDLSIHPSVAKAEEELEAEDVRKGEYVAYDADGRLLALSTRKEQARGLLGSLGIHVELVHIGEAETEPNHRDALREALSVFLADLGWPRPVLQTLTIDELVQRALDPRRHSQ